jgi:tRNA dimethylallyltransferase
MHGIAHHCIDIASPRRPYTAAQWRTRAEKAVRSIGRKDTVPIVAGGTGFYIDALVFDNQFPQVRPNATLRALLARKTPEELFAQLSKLDPIRAESIEVRNPRRLIRALEIALTLGSVPPRTTPTSRFDVLWLGLDPGLQELERRIVARLDGAIRKGLVAETQKLHTEIGLSWKRINELGLEYRIVGQHLRGELTEAAMREQMRIELRRYAQRQIRWFKRNKDIMWFENAADALAYARSAFLSVPQART